MLPNVYFSAVITNSTFSKNTATQGGAIKYTKIASNMTNLTFTNNTAGYGPNIASYPISI